MAKGNSIWASDGTMAASEKGYENGLGAMSSEERTAAYENGLGAMSAEARMVASKKGYENGIRVMAAREKRSSNDKWARGRGNLKSSNDAWECQREDSITYLAKESVEQYTF